MSWNEDAKRKHEYPEVFSPGPLFHLKTLRVPMSIQSYDWERYSTILVYIFNLTNCHEYVIDIEESW